MDASNPILSQQLATKETAGVQNSERTPNTQRCIYLSN